MTQTASIYLLITIAKDRVVFRRLITCLSTRSRRLAMRWVRWRQVLLLYSLKTRFNVDMITIQSMMRMSFVLHFQPVLLGILPE